MGVIYAYYVSQKNYGQVMRIKMGDKREGYIFKIDSRFQETSILARRVGGVAPRRVLSGKCHHSRLPNIEREQSVAVGRSFCPRYKLEFRWCTYKHLIISESLAMVYYMLHSKCSFFEDVLSLLPAD